ncbi:hypothetical protein ACFVAJ_18560 [Agromyces sp. NPDC057679]|uniref:hypothetical protein n=1 Tax=Agromyces sp. NPDC057679 TaxID=3346207 RepID=UPI00366DBC35
MDDDDDEYWYQCNECEGTGQVNIPVGSDESITSPGTCPNCEGSGVIQGDSDDELYGFIRVPS